MKESKFRRMNIITTLLCLIPIIMGAVWYAKLPVELPVHFGPNGKPDRFAAKEVALFLIPAVLMAVHVFVCVLTGIDSKKKQMSKSVEVMVRMLIPCVSTFIQVIVITYGMNVKQDVSLWSTAFLGVMFIVIGNLLPKCRQNGMIGIRMSTTLSNEENWNKTHRIAGFVWVIGGMGILAGSILKNWLVTVVILVVMVVFPMIYSYSYAIKTRK